MAILADLLPAMVGHKARAGRADSPGRAGLRRPLAGVDGDRAGLRGKMATVLAIARVRRAVRALTLRVLPVAGNPSLASASRIIVVLMPIDLERHVLAMPAPGRGKAAHL